MLKFYIPFHVILLYLRFFALTHGVKVSICITSGVRAHVIITNPLHQKQFCNKASKPDMWAKQKVKKKKLHKLI